MMIAISEKWGTHYEKSTKTNMENNNNMRFFPPQALMNQQANAPSAETSPPVPFPFLLPFPIHLQLENSLR